MHEFLEIKTEFRHWLPRICEYGFESQVDYTPVIFEHPANKQSTTDYQMKIEMAKEICMITRNDKGKEARQYFIQLEKAWNNPELVMARSLQFANRKILEYESKVKELAPKAENYDILMSSDGCMDFLQFTKTANLIFGRNTFMGILRGRRILTDGNLPHQSFMNRNYFKVTSVVKDGKIYHKTIITTKGVEYLVKLCKENGFIKE